MAAAGPGGRGRGWRSFPTHSPAGGPRLNPQAQARAFQGKHLKRSWRVPRGSGMAQTSTFEVPILLGVLQRCPGGGRGQCPVRTVSLALLCPVLTAASSALGCRFTVSTCSHRKSRGRASTEMGLCVQGTCPLRAPASARAQTRDCPPPAARPLILGPSPAPGTA